MPEFRVFTGNETDDSDSFDLGSVLDNVIKNVKQDPELKLEIAQRLQEEGINPKILKAIDSDAVPSQQEVAQLQQAQQAANQQQEASQTMDNEPEVKKVTEKPSADQVIGFLDEIREYVDDDWTLADLKQWAEQNKDIVETAIEMKF